MYRQYENPRELEKTVEYWKQRREECLNSIHNLEGVGLTDMRTGYTHYDVLQDELEMIEENIAEYEQRANFAWQDEEFG